MEVLRMANKRIENKAKQVEIIESNIDIILALVNIFKGQVLNIDLQEFCIASNICNENEYKGLINKLIKNKLVRIKKFRNTSNNVIVANAPLTNYFGKNAIKYSVETVIRNSYLVYLIKLRYPGTTNIEALVKHLEENTTFLSSKRRVETCYKSFMKLNESGEKARIEAIYREEKRKEHLKHKKQDEQLVDMELVFDYTMQTLRERDIFISQENGHYTIFIMDNKNPYTLAKVAEKIALAICLLSFQVDLELEEYKVLDIIVLVRDAKAKEKLENNFITKYNEGEKINIDYMINKKSKKIHSNIKADFEYKSRTEKGVYILKNPYNEQTEAFKKLRIKIQNANTEEKHNSNMKASALVERRKNIREKEIREQLLQELRAKGLLIESSNELDYI